MSFSVVNLNMVTFLEEQNYTSSLIPLCVKQNRVVLKGWNIILIPNMNYQEVNKEKRNAPSILI